MMERAYRPDLSVVADMEIGCTSPRQDPKPGLTSKEPAYGLFRQTEISYKYVSHGCKLNFYEV